MKENKAQITEIFSSIQGEGIFLGAKQIFVRFKTCNLDCAFCDVPKDLEPKAYSVYELMKKVKDMEASKGPHHSVSLTGGEPLLYADFLRIFLNELRKKNFKTYLETNGTLPDELLKVADLVDIIAMDFKLPSSTGERAFWNEHAEFLKIAAKKKVFVKAVVTTSTEEKDIEKAISLIKKIRVDIPLILQPATPVKSSDRHVNSDMLLRFVDIGSRSGMDSVRVIPQVHKVLGVK